MSEPDMTPFGPASGFDGQQFVMIVPLRKSTTAKFSIEAVETAVEIMLVDSIPDGVMVDGEKPMDKTWSEEYITPPGHEEQVLIRMSVFLKEEPSGNE